MTRQISLQPLCFDRRHIDSDGSRTTQLHRGRLSRSDRHPGACPRVGE